MKIFLASLLMTIGFAQAQSFKYSSNISSAEELILAPKLEEILRLLPQRLLEGLPREINISLSNFGHGLTELPKDVCEDTKSAFKYGQYRHIDRSLVLNRALVTEFAKGKNLSYKIDCQHGSLYQQAVATVIHELGHAYDSQSGKPSAQKDFANIGGFKKSLIFTGRKNDTPMRSPDEYEFKNPAESFAVNLEYFVLDEAFGCRRPVMQSYFQKLLGVDPHPGRSCKINRSLMVTSSLGMIPVKVDPARVYRIDYLLAAPGSDASSGFGHSMYRLVICAPDYVDPITGKQVKGTPFGEKCLKDKLFHLVVSYRANNQNATLDYFKGIFGGYPSMLFILSFADVLEEYNRTELRDLTSYPMKLSPAEKVDFMNRISEEHWGYKGSYKFITTNCATESLRIIKNNLVERREELGIGSRIIPTLTPVGLRHLLETSGLIDQKDPAIEKFPAKLDHLIAAFSLAYGHQRSTAKKDNKSLSEFILESSLDERVDAFNSALAERDLGADSKSSLIAQKKLTVKLASFSLLEQQVIQVRVGLLKKKVAEMLADENFQKQHPELVALQDAEKKRDGIERSSSSGYGIPVEHEMISMKQVENSIMDLQKNLEQSDALLKRLFAEETAELETLSTNLKEMNRKSLELRRSFKQNLEKYVGDELRKISKTSQGLTATPLEIRQLLGESLVTEKEISDEKILRLIKPEEL